MKTELRYWTKNEGWQSESEATLPEIPSFTLVFFSPSLAEKPGYIKSLLSEYPSKIYFGCSTSGEICGIKILDSSLVILRVLLEKSSVVYKQSEIMHPDYSFQAGRELAESIDFKGLRHVLVLSDGLNINGSELVRGIRNSLPEPVSVTGGLAGDGADFKETYLLDNFGNTQSKCISALAFYGNNIEVGFGCYGGWDSFGVERLVTKSKSNILYELDNEPALGLYKSFLGDQAKNLPSSALLFPLSLRYKADSLPVVRTILGVDENEQCMVFAGDIPEGSYVRLMKANMDRLIDGAVKAAGLSLHSAGNNAPEFALLISCVGRRLVLKQMAEEEVEGVSGVLGKSCSTAGFYSYGEISPFSDHTKCELHNQTMTITTFKEN